VRDKVVHHDILLGRNFTLAPFEKAGGVGYYSYLFGKKCTHCHVAIKKFIFSSITKTNIQTFLKTVDAVTNHVYHQQALGDSRPYFPNPPVVVRS